MSYYGWRDRRSPGDRAWDFVFAVFIKWPLYNFLIALVVAALAYAAVATFGPYQPDYWQTVRVWFFVISGLDLLWILFKKGLEG